MFDKPRLPVRQALLEGGLPSPLQRRVYRRRGYRIAHDVHFGPGVVIDAAEVDIAAGVTIGPGTVLRGKSIRIGRRVSIGATCFFDGGTIELDDDVVVREQVFVGGPMTPDSQLTVGKRSRIFQSCFLNHSRPLRIGDDTGVGGRSSIFTHGSWQSEFEGYPVSFQPVDIGNNVWLPWHVFILPGVTIGDGATIGAGSIVNRSITAGSLAVGAPAREIRGSDAWPAADGQEPREVLSRVLDELAAYFGSEGLTVDPLPEGFAVTYDGRRRRIGRGAEDWGRDDVAVVAGEAPQGGAFWFDVLDKTKQRASTDPVVVEVEQWLNRYGVRFQPRDERD